jgi:hypothetical protein
VRKDEPESEWYGEDRMRQGLRLSLKARAGSESEAVSDLSGSDGVKAAAPED